MFPGILHNTILFSAITAWLIAQILKLLINLMLQRKLDLPLLWSSGSFPSSHTATVSSLAMGIGKYYGWNSPIFAVAAVFAMIVMYDAAGVRRAAGKQAEAINQLVERLYQGSEPNQERLKELIGHSPFEVLGGAVVGVLVGIIV